MACEKEPNGLFLFPKRLNILSYRMLFLIKSFWKCTFLPKFKAGPRIIYRRQKTISSVSTKEYVLLCSAMRNYGGL